VQSENPIKKGCPTTAKQYITREYFKLFGILAGFLFLLLLHRVFDTPTLSRCISNFHHEFICNLDRSHVRNTFCYACFSYCFNKMIVISNTKFYHLRSLGSFYTPGEPICQPLKEHRLIIDFRFYCDICLPDHM